MLTHIQGGRLIDPPPGGGPRVNADFAGISHAGPARSDRDQTPTLAPGHAGRAATAEGLWFEGDRVVPAPPAAKADRVIDASGCIVLAGGIDLHTHIGGGKVNLARLLLEDELNRVASPFLPTAPQTAARYLDMGYTTCFEPAVIPCNARSAHAEMADVRGLDTGGYCLLGNEDCLLRMISAGCPQSSINDYVAWMVRATQCLAVKVVNAGGISAFKFNAAQLDVDQPHPKYGVTPATVIRVLCRAVHEIGLPHPLHVHCSNLGAPGNIQSTLATIRAADGYPIHLAHVQFHSYGDSGPHGISSAAAALVEAMQQHPRVTMDVGQVMFGQTVTISADSMHQFANRRHAHPRKSALLDVECEAGCGVIPFRYQNRQYVHSLQWAIGLELFLLMDDPTRVFLTTDHPNGAPFTTYPHLIRLLADRSFRETALAEIHRDAAASSSLSGITREYTLEEIAVMTRSAPAAILGLQEVGNLRPGSLADIVIYESDSDATERDYECVFSKPRYVIRRGQIVRGPGATDEQKIENITWTARPNFDAENVARLFSRYDLNPTFARERLWISDEELETVIGSRAVNPRAESAA